MCGNRANKTTEFENDFGQSFLEQKAPFFE